MTRLHPVLIALPLLLGGADCSRSTPPESGAKPGPTPIERATRLAETGPDAPLLLMQLGDGASPTGPAHRPSLAETEPLSPDRQDALLARLDALPAAERVAFRQRADSTPPPLPGEAIGLPFPPPPAEAETPDTEAGPLEIVRVTPDGDVPVLPRLTVQFNRSAVPLTTHANASQQIPITLEPMPADAVWRWAGTRALVLEPVGSRLPMATTFTVTLPEGATTSTGATAAATETVTVSTPPVSVEAMVPRGGPTARQPVIALRFDQAIDADAILEHLEVLAAGEPVPVHRATAAEIAEDPSARALFRSPHADRHLALRPDAPLPTATTVTVALPAGAPSAEGPRTTSSRWSDTFTTHGPLALQEVRCGYSARNPCRPRQAWSARFTNPIDVEQDLDAMVSVEPPIDDLQLSASGSWISIQGSTTPETTYTVTFAAGLTDTFSQTLGTPATDTVRVGPPQPARPSILGPGGDVVTPDPSDAAAVTFQAAGMKSVRVQVSRMDSPDLEAWRTTGRHDWGSIPALPGTPLLDETRDLSDPDTWNPVRIDLSPWDAPDVAGLVVQVSTPRGTPRDDVRTTRAWVVPTTTALVVASDSHEIAVWATDARTGRGLPDADVSLWTDGRSRSLGQTDASGLLRAELPGEGIVMVRAGDDLAWVAASGALWSGGRWRTSSRGTTTLFHVFDDRHLYRPDETVHVKGWARRVDFSEGGDVLPPEGLAGELTWTLWDAQRVELATGTTTIDALGGFSLDLDLPETPNLGTARLRVSGAGGSTDHTFDIREFRRPTFEVSTVVEDEGPFVIGDDATAAVTASYLAGGPLPGADVRWQVTARTAFWRAPGWDRFDFDPDVSWWWSHDFGHAARGGFGGFGGGEEVRETHTGSTDATGTHRLRIGLLGAREDRTLQVSAQATVQDVDRQTFSGSTSLLAHPSTRAVGVRPAKPFFDKDEPVEVSLIVTTLAGEPVADVPIEAALVRHRASWSRGRWSSEEVERLPCSVASADAPVQCVFEPEHGGSWQIEATVADAEGRTWTAAGRVTVAGGDPLPLAEGVDTQKVVLTPDAETYQPGETARILVTAPFAPADARITWKRSGLVHAETRRLQSASTTLEVPIEAGMTPDLTIDVHLTGTRTREDGRQAPVFGRGSTTLSIPPTFRALDVAVSTPDSEVSPGSKTNVEVVVTHEGRPVSGAQVAVVMVDEAVLALTNTTIGDPLATFHPGRGANVHETATWGWIRLAKPELPEPEGDAMDEMAESEASVQSFGAGSTARRGAMRKSAAMPMEMAAADVAAPPPSSGPPIAVRTDFRADALWVPAVRTDRRGRATLPVALPDSLTRYRLTAVAVDDTQRFGMGESTLTARLPLQVRPSLPRFLNVGDRAEMPFIVHNRTDRALTVDLAVRASNLGLARGDRDGRRLTVPADDRVEVRLTGTTDDAGEIVLQAAAASGALTDAALARLPVLTPTTREGFAAYGELSGADGTVAIRQALDVPADVWPQFGGLDISTSTTRLSALTDAMIAVHEYPFGCSEQISSRVLTTAALAEVLDAFDAEGLPDPETLRAEIARDLEELVRRRNADGGWPWWQRGRPSSAWLTLHATHALWRAKDAGFDVPEHVLADALRRADEVERFLPSWAGERTRQIVRAYGVYLQELGGLAPDAEARRLWNTGRRSDLPLTAMGWILPTLDRIGDSAVGEIEDILRDRVTETARTAQFTTSWSEADAALILHGDRRTDGILLETWLRVWPEEDGLPGKLVEGLLGGRSKGHWGSTQDNAWVLLALQKYFRVKEAVVPDLTARAWLGDALVASHRFAGRTTEQASVRVPMPWLTDGRAQDDLVVAREGKGRLYWRLGLRYAPKALDLPPAEHGFSVSRTFESIDDPGDVTRDDDGVWRVKAGARVRVRLWMTAPARRYHVALVDNLPAGFEPLDPSLVGTEDVPSTPASNDSWRRGWWWGPWFEHENLRDDRVEAFARTVWPGVHAYTYTARATTPGSFIVMPARAEEMYSPETFGRSATERVLVVDPGTP